MDVVTGAFSFTGKYIAARLLGLGREVRTLTRHDQSASPFGGSVRAFPLDFADPGGLRDALRRTDTLYNTYWIRSPRREVTFDRAIVNTKVLLTAAREAGVRRVVQLSVSNASLFSPLPYFRGKALADEVLAASGFSYAIVRPTLIFAREDVLVNNIAWLLRRLPLFVIPGDGEYTLQPIAAEDVAQLSVEAAGSDEPQAFDAAGPDVFSFEGSCALCATRSARGPASSMQASASRMAWERSWAPSCATRSSHAQSSRA